MVSSAKIVDHQTKGAYTESIDIGPELMQILMSSTGKRRSLLRSSSRPIQPDVIIEHLARTAGRRHIALGAEANCDAVNIGQIYALIGKGL